jgi:GDPmannose 4,6-dehydratase
MQWLMLQQDRPEDYVIATGEQHSVRDFVERRRRGAGHDHRLAGERGRGARHRPPERRDLVAVDPRYFRPTEVETLLGDPTKAREQLGWRPRTSFKEMVAEMVRQDLMTAERDNLCRSAGFPTPDYHE